MQQAEEKKDVCFCCWESYLDLTLYTRLHM